MSRPVQTIHKQGYVFKQGSFFSTWNERYFSLETSLLKQFTDADNALPTYSIYLGTAAVDGLFSPEDNTDNGHGNMWSFVIRWPLPSAPDILEEQWGYMHLGAYDRSEIEEWYDSILALQKVEQTKRLMASVRSGGTTPPEAFPIPAGRTPTILRDTQESRDLLSSDFSSLFDKFVDVFNSSPRCWEVVSSVNEGMLFRSRNDGNCWKFSIPFPKHKAGPKRIWESVLSLTANKWEPLVQNACAEIDDQDAVMKNDKQLVSDTWSMTSRVKSVVPVEIGASLERVGFRDDKSGIYVVLGKPCDKGHKGRHVSFDSIFWSVESVSENFSLLTVFWTLTKVQSDLPFGLYASVFSESVAEAITRPTALRMRSYILSQ